MTRNQNQKKKKKPLRAKFQRGALHIIFGLRGMCTRVYKCVFVRQRLYGIAHELTQLFATITSASCSLALSVFTAARRAHRGADGRGGGGGAKTNGDRGREKDDGGGARVRHRRDGRRKQRRATRTCDQRGRLAGETSRNGNVRLHGQQERLQRRR